MAGGGLRALEHRADAAGDGDVVVLDQHGIVEAEAVVETAAAAHGVLLQGAQARRRLAGAANAHARARDAAHEFMRRRRHSGKMADEIERHPFGGKHGAGGTRDRHERGLRRDGGAITRMGRDLDIGCKLGKGRGHER
jgi:hypothetical protein